MARANNGSIIVILLLALSILLVLVFASWHSLVQMRLLAQARVAVAQERSLVQGLLHIGVSYCLQDRVACRKEQYNGQTWHLTFDPWPSREIQETIGHYHAYLDIAIKHNEWRIAASVCKKNKSPRRGSCAIRLTGDDDNLKTEIVDWDIS